MNVDKAFRFVNAKFFCKECQYEISAEEIKKIALLSRLEVKDDQIETVGKQLNDILSYMDLLGQVDVTGVKPTAHAVAMSNVMRDDVPQPSISNEKALQNAPEQDEGYFKVPKVIQD